MIPPCKRIRYAVELSSREYCDYPQLERSFTDDLEFKDSVNLLAYIELVTRLSTVTVACLDHQNKIINAVTIQSFGECIVTNYFEDYSYSAYYPEDFGLKVKSVFTPKFLRGQTNRGDFLFTQLAKEVKR